MTLNQLIEQLSKNSSLENFFPLPEPVKTVCETFGGIYCSQDKYESSTNNYADFFTFKYFMISSKLETQYYPENLGSGAYDIIVVQDLKSVYWYYSIAYGWYTKN